MTVRQKFIYEWPPGSTRIEFRSWIDTLPQDEQDEYWLGRKNGDALRQKAIDEGWMVIGQSEYIWTDKAAFIKNKENDPIWEKYWRRWQKETGVKFSMEIIEE